jgi:excisionase family DNA binding protein
MKIATPIPAASLTAIHALLEPHVPGISPTGLVAALRTYEPGGREEAASGCRMVTVREAADLLATSIYTVRRMVADGRLPGKRLGRDYRIPLEAIREMTER